LAPEKVVRGVAGQSPPCWKADVRRACCHEELDAENDEDRLLALDLAGPLGFLRQFGEASPGIPRCGLPTCRTIRPCTARSGRLLRLPRRQRSGCRVVS